MKRNAGNHRRAQSSLGATSQKSSSLKHKREVLRWKKPVMADILDFSISSQNEYKERALLNDSILKEILPEQTDKGRVHRFLELIISKGPEDTYDKLCELMIERGQSWIADELYADLVAESGEMILDDYVLGESAMIVHRYFGQSTRVSEADKKQIKLLIAQRYQAAKEAWIRQLKLVRKEVEHLVELRNDDIGRVHKMSDKIQAFIRSHQTAIHAYTHDKESTAMFLRNGISSKNTLKDNYKVLDEYIDSMFSIISLTSLEKERIDKERNRCLEILNVKTTSADLSVALTEALRQSNEETKKYKKEAEMSNILASSVDARLREVHTETSRNITDKERQVMYTEGRLEEKEIKILELEDENAKQSNEISDLELELKNLQRKCEMLEKTRRLGYYQKVFNDGNGRDRYGFKSAQRSRSTSQLSSRSEDKSGTSEVWDIASPRLSSSMTSFSTKSAYPSSNRQRPFTTMNVSRGYNNKTPTRLSRANKASMLHDIY